MEGGLTLAEKGDKTVPLKTTGTSMRCTVLLGVTINWEKLTPFVVFMGKPDGRIARYFGGMPDSMRYICQDKAWVDHRVFKNGINLVWAPFALEKGDSTYLLMDEFSVHLMASCSNQIKGCGTTIDYILGGYTSKLQVMNVGVNKTFKGYVRQAYENFMIGNIQNRKDRREDIVQWIEIGWEKVKVETITRTWTKVGIEIVTTAV